MNDKNTDYKNIQHFLLENRNKMHLSQEEIANQLADFNAQFSDIDAQTISRWELGKVSPSLYRQVMLMQYFQVDAHQLLANKHFDLPLLPSIKGFEKHLAAGLEFKHIFAAHPYIDATDDFVSLTHIPDNISALCQQISAYTKNISQAELTLEPDYLQALITHPSSAHIFYMANELLLGHLIALRLRPEFAHDLACDIIKDYDIKLQHLADEGAPHVLYFLSSYSGTRTSVKKLIVELFALAAKNALCEKILMKTRTDFGVKLITLFESERIHRGAVCEGKKQGVKEGNKRYSHISYSVTREHILASPVYLNLARNQEPEF